jgi:hypothetical protein
VSGKPTPVWRGAYTLKKLHVTPEHFAQGAAVFRRAGDAYTAWIATLTADDAYAVGRLVGAIMQAAEQDIM